MFATRQRAIRLLLHRLLAALAGVALLFNLLMVLVAILAIVMTIPKARQQPASAVRS